MHGFNRVARNVPFDFGGDKRKRGLTFSFLQGQDDPIGRWFVTGRRWMGRYPGDEAVGVAIVSVR
jgi:hypothetical protein